MIALICPKISNRVKYIQAFLSSRFTLDTYLVLPDDAINLDHLVINYTNQVIQNSFSVYNSGLLFDHDIDETVYPEVAAEDGVPVLFPSSTPRYHINFDVLSSIFYCLSRYEEYLAIGADEHGRFSADRCHAFANDYLLRPVVDEWLIYLENELQSFFGISFPSNEKFTILPTVDIDSAWAYRHRSMTHNLGSGFKQVITLQWSKLIDRVQAARKGTDPYDTFEYLRTQLSEYHPVFFYLMNGHRPFDTAHYIDKKEFHGLVKSTSMYSQTGMHPSYQSHQSIDQLRKEKNKLESILDDEIILSRQHFLKFSLPDTYNSLLSMGIQQDYSMGYADQPGFRAGTSLPFFFYDLKEDESTTLQIVPFAVMDVTLKNYLNLSVEEARGYIQNIKGKLKEVNGQFSFIWHNSSFSESDGWKDWKQVFEECLVIA